MITDDDRRMRIKKVVQLRGLFISDADAAELFDKWLVEGSSRESFDDCSNRHLSYWALGMALTNGLHTSR